MLPLLSTSELFADDQELLTDLGEGVGGDTLEHSLAQTLRGGFLPLEVEAADALPSLSYLPAATEE